MEFQHRELPGTGRTLLLLHGTGGDEGQLLEVGRLLDPQATLLSPRGPVLENGMPRFFRRFRDGSFDVDDLRLRTGQLADWVLDRTASRGRPLAVGYSNGANIAAALLLLRPEVLAGAILFRAMAPLVPEQAPDLAGTRVLIVAGRHDPIVPAGQPAELARLLRTAGAEVALEVREAGHELGAEDLRVAGSWLGGGVAGSRN